MATVMINNDANKKSADGAQNMHLRNNMAINNLLIAYPDALPADFKLVFHNDLRYQKRDRSWSEDCYCGIIPFYGGKEHMEFAMLQWDLLTEDIAVVDANGDFEDFATPNDELHTFARNTASADKTIESWFKEIVDHFNTVANWKFVKLSYNCAYESRKYTKTILGIVAK